MTKIFIVFLFCALFITSAAQSVEESKCSYKFASNLAKLKTYAFAINLDDPKSDLEVRIRHNDYRLLSINGFVLEYPGLTEFSHRKILEKVGARNIQGTSDALEGEEHADLMHRFRIYAAAYNKLMVNYLKNRENCPVQVSE